MQKQTPSISVLELGDGASATHLTTEEDKEKDRLSTSTSSSFEVETLDPHDPKLSKLANKMFRKTEDFITNELNAPLEDYKMLIEMNKITVAKYSDMRQISENLAASTNELSMKFRELMPLMEQIDDISDSIDKLEAASYKLDAYSIALETRVKSVLKHKSKSSP